MLSPAGKITLPVTVPVALPLDAVALITGGGGVVLPFNPVVVMQGDSQSKGTPTAGEIAAYKASYVVTDKVKVLNNSNAWVNYDPNNNLSGVDLYSTTTGNAGFEAGFIPKFLAAYPSNTLYLAKFAGSGSFQGRAASSVGTITGSISGNILTVTAGTPQQNMLIIGTGVPAGTYIMFQQSGNNWYVGKLGQASNVNYTVASTTLTMWNAALSWSSAEGTLYNGHSNSITNQTRGKLTAGLATLTNYRIVSWLSVLGTNDMSNTTTGAAFEAAQSAFFTRIASDFDLTNAQIVMPRVMTGGTASTTVRAAQAANKAADPTKRKLFDMDDGTLHDGTHWNYAALVAGGQRWFDVTFGLSAGL